MPTPTRELVYIAGPFSAPSELERRVHTNNALLVARKVIQFGGTPIVPHALFGALHGAVSEQEILIMCLELLGRCPNVLFLPGYEHSRGSMAELGESLQQRKNVYFAPDYEPLRKRLQRAKGKH